MFSESVDDEQIIERAVVVKSNETVQPILLGSCSFWFRRGWRGR